VLAEALLVRPADLLGAADLRDVHLRLHHLVHTRARRRERRG